MTDLLSYWPVTVPIAIALGYELLAVYTQVAHSTIQLPTISQMTWRRVTAWTPLQRFGAFVAMVGLAVALAGHFFYDWWR